MGPSIGTTVHVQFDEFGQMPADGHAFEQRPMSRQNFERQSSFLVHGAPRSPGVLVSVGVVSAVVSGSPLSTMSFWNTRVGELHAATDHTRKTQALGALTERIISSP
jgi:hypothetical protein